MRAPDRRVADVRGLTTNGTYVTVAVGALPMSPGPRTRAARSSPVSTAPLSPGQGHASGVSRSGTSATVRELFWRGDVGHPGTISTPGIACPRSERGLHSYPRTQPTRLAQRLLSALFAQWFRATIRPDKPARGPPG